MKRAAQSQAGRVFENPALVNQSLLTRGHIFEFFNFFAENFPLLLSDSKHLAFP